MPHTAIDETQVPEGITGVDQPVGEDVGEKIEFLDANDIDESPTTISNATIIEDVIPDMERRLDTISESGSFVDKEGVERFADGAVVSVQEESDIFLENLATFNKKFGRASNDSTGIKKTEGGGLDTTGAFDDKGNVIGGEVRPLQTDLEIETDTINREIDELLASMKLNLDEQTKRQIDSIEQLYSVRRAQLSEINRRAAEAINQSLLIGGSSRFAPISSAGIVQAKETASLLAISQLDAEEKALINQARQAQTEGDFELFGKKLELAQARRNEKIEAARSLNEIIAKENEKLRDRNIRSSRDTAIANLVAQGVSDPVDLLEFLNFDDQRNRIGDFTAEEISDLLGFIEKAEETSFSFEELGIINQQTGLDLPIGTTQADLMRMGIVPKGKTTKSFTYKTVGNQILRIDEDGNPTVIFTGKEEENPFTTQQRFSNTFSFQKEQTDNAKDFIIQRNAVDRIATALARNTPAGDLAAIFAFMKAQDPNSVVRESEFATAAQARAEITRTEKLGIPIPTVVTQGIRRLNTGEKLTDAQQKDFLDTANSIFDSALASQVAIQSQSRIAANLMGLDPEIAVPDQTLIKAKLQQKIQPGEIIVWSINDNEVGFVPIDEYEANTDLYLIF